jgi:DNA-directed RNA polymerase specialized sigma24 family protein
MTHDQPPGPSEYGFDVDVFLLQLEPFIVSLVRHITRSSSFYDWEREDLAQRVRTKLALTLPGKKIDHLPAYLRRCVSNEFVSLLRQRKPFLPLPLTDEGEILTEVLLFSNSDGHSDPLWELEQKMAFEELLERVVEGVLLLPPVQKLAMLCLLSEQVDDFSLLFAAFKRRNVDISTASWPEDRFLRQRLRASCRPAVFNLARHLDINLALYKRWRKVQAS